MEVITQLIDALTRAQFQSSSLKIYFYGTPGANTSAPGPQLSTGFFTVFGGQRADISLLGLQGAAALDALLNLKLTRVMVIPTQPQVATAQALPIVEILQRLTKTGVAASPAAPPLLGGTTLTPEQSAQLEAEVLALLNNFVGGNASKVLQQLLSGQRLESQAEDLMRALAIFLEGLCGSVRAKSLVNGIAQRVGLPIKL